jgi:hypothetical protein
MIQLVLILVIGCSLLVIVGLLLRDAMRTRPERSTAVGAGGSAPLQIQIPSRALMDRIFAEDDLSFVAAEGSRLIRKQFLKDRRNLALAWLSQTRREATRILGFHLRAVRTDAFLRPSVELQLVLHTVLFFAVYALLWCLVSGYGAFWARGFIRDVVTLAGRLSGLGGSILADAGRSGLRVAQSHGHA